MTCDVVYLISTAYWYSVVISKKSLPDGHKSPWHKTLLVFVVLYNNLSCNAQENYHNKKMRKITTMRKIAISAVLYFGQIVCRHIL